MATPHPLDQLLIVSGCIRGALVRTLAAATFTRRSLEINPVMQGATLQQLRNLRTGMLLYTRALKGMVLGQLLPESHL